MKIRRMKRKMRETVKSAKWRVEENQTTTAHESWMTWCGQPSWANVTCDIEMSAVKHEKCDVWRCSVHIFHSAHCSPSNHICFRSVWCRRTVIPGKIFTSLAKFQGIISVNDLRLPVRLQELLQASLPFPEKFLFCTDMTGSIGWLDPARRLHVDDCFEIRNCRLGPCDLLLSSHQNLQHEVRLRHCVFCTVPLWFWSFLQISQFRSLGKWVFVLCLPKSSLLVDVGSKDSSWEELGVSLCVQELYHPRDSLWILAAIPICRNLTGLSVLYRGLRFYLVLEFWLAWSTGLTVLSFQYVYLTQILDRNLSHTGHPVLFLIVA